MREVLKEQKEEWRKHRRVYIRTLQIPGEYGHGYGWPCNVGDGGQHLSTVTAVTVFRPSTSDANKWKHTKVLYLLDKLLGAHFS